MKTLDTGTLSRVDRWQTSRELLERARKSLPAGVASPFRAQFPVPLHFQDGRGSRLIDVDGNEYIDYTLAWGPAILGHRHPALVEALATRVRQPIIYGAQHELEYEVAEKIQALVACAELVAFTSSGSEAVQAVLRLARAATGRNLILRFEGHYHGWLDSVLVSYKPGPEAVGPLEEPQAVLGSRGQPPNSTENLLVLPWNRLDLVEALFQRRGEQIAAVIMEPVLCNSGCLMPVEGYLEGVRAITRRHGALLIFDEVITGFRMAPGGAQQHFGVTPDLATFGKAIGGGVPLSAFAGRRDVMEEMLRGAAYGGTFNGNPLSLAAAKATLEVLSRDGGAALAHANRIGDTLMAGIRDAAARHGVPLRVEGFGGAFALHFTGRDRLTHYRDTFEDDRQRLRSYLLAVLEHGVYLLPDGRVYVSAVHTAEDAAETLGAVERVFRSWAV